MTTATLTTEAAALLTSPSTSPALLSWAAGVWAGGHALYFVTLPMPTERLAPTHSGAHWDGYSLLGTPAGLTVTVAGNFMHRISWRDAAAHATIQRVGADLHAQILEAMRVRRDLTTLREYRPNRPMSWYHTEEAQQQRDQWSEHEAYCAELAAQAWQRCRPGNTAHQPSLFDLLAA